jgi:thiamine biosynthesis lipoprotein
MINRLLSIIIGLCILTSSCKEKKSVFSSFSGLIQGTTYSVVFENRHKIDPEEMKTDVEIVLHDFDMSLSLYQDSSIISRINRNEDVTTDKYFNEVFRKSAIISEMTNGAFDITVGPLVKAWGFGPDAHKNFSESKRDSLMKFVGMEKVSLRNGHVLKSDPGIHLDVNAIAQGYSVDVICDFFDIKGIKNYLVEIGGEVRGKGTKAGSKWRIGIDKPSDDNMFPGQTLQAIIEISDKALATSGNYRKFYIEDGVKYSHTIDPKSGYPANNNLLSATIIADDCALADGIATACMVMGKERSVEFLGNHPEFEAYLVFSDENGDYKAWATDRLKNDISETGIN